jgi:hypothetical protein
MRISVILPAGASRSSRGLVSFQRFAAIVRRRLASHVGTALAGAYAVAAAVGRPASAQVVDTGTLFILKDGEVVGREEFTVRRGPGFGSGYTVSTTVLYPATRPTKTLSFDVELGPDTLPTGVQIEVTGPDPHRVYAVFGVRRVTIRTVRPGREAARELPGAPRHLLLDDSAFALQAMVPRAGTGGFTALAPRHDRRAAARLTGQGEARTVINGVAQTLEQLTFETDNRSRHLWYDQHGRLMKVEDLRLGLVAERREGPR